MKKITFHKVAITFLITVIIATYCTIIYMSESASTQPQAKTPVATAVENSLRNCEPGDIVQFDDGVLMVIRQKSSETVQFRGFGFNGARDPVTIKSASEYVTKVTHRRDTEAWRAACVNFVLQEVVSGTNSPAVN